MNRQKDHRAPILFLIIILAAAALGLALQAAAAASVNVERFADNRGEPTTIARPLTATTTYTITDLGANVYPQGVNDAGQVAGYMVDGGVTSGFLWEDGALTSLPTLDGSTTYAYDINEAGDIAGMSRNADGFFAAVAWRDGAIVPLQHSGSRSFALALNDDGAVVGLADVDDDDPLVEHAVLWQGGGRVDLHQGTGVASQASDVNDLGQIVGGYSSDDGVAHGALWDGGQMTFVDPDWGGSVTQLFGINATGDVVGTSTDAAGSRRAFIRMSDGTVHDLGAPPDSNSDALALNDSGEVVGSMQQDGEQRAFLWKDGAFTDLNERIDSESGWTLEAAYDVNESGQIVGWGTLDGVRRGFLLTPDAAPWTVLFYLAGDNNLSNTYPPILNRLEAAADNEAVNVVALMDLAGGPAAIYHVQHDDDLSALAGYVEGETKWEQGELNTGFPTTLSDFAIWAIEEFPADHVALVLDDHGSGLGGGLVDDTSGRTMNLPEMQLALATIHEQTERKIDVLYMAMCLMGMVEDAYQFREHADYYVASEQVMYAFRPPYHGYVAGIEAASTPADVAQNFADAYADAAASGSQAYTVSVIDMARVQEVTDAAYELGVALELNMLDSRITPTLTAVLSDVQRFDNKASRGTINTADTSIDLYHFADLTSIAFVTRTDILTRATGLMSAVDAAVLHERHASSASTNLDNAHGLSVFFPSNSSSFYNPGNYDFAVGATWSGSPSLARPAQEGWAGMISTYVELVHPDAPDEDAPPEPVPKLLPSWDLYLPSVNRAP